MYIGGGFSGSSSSTNINYAVINNGGNGPFTSNSWSVAQEPYDATSPSTSYQCLTNSTFFNTEVNYSPCMADATTNTFDSGNEPTFVGYTGSATAVYDGCMFIAEGGTANQNAPASANNLVSYSHIQPDGSYGNWYTTSSPDGNVTSAQLFAVDGYLYLMGGINGTNVNNNAYYAKITTTGATSSSGGSCSLGSFTQLVDDSNNTENLHSATAEAGTASYGNCMYLINGENSYGSVSDGLIQYAAVDPATGKLTSGTGGDWKYPSDYGDAFSGDFAPEVTAYGGYLYIIGGSPQSTEVDNEVYSTPINTSNCSLGTFTAATYLPAKLQNFFAASYNGYMYVVGGQNGTGSSNATPNVWDAPIYANGQLGQWQAGVGLPVLPTGTTSSADGRGIWGQGCSNTNDATGLFGLTGAVSNGNLYILGGKIDCFQNSTDSDYALSVNNAYYIGIGSQAREATYSSLNDLSGINFDDPNIAYMSVSGTQEYPSNGSSGKGGFNINYELAQDASGCKSFSAPIELTSGSPLLNTVYSATSSSQCGYNSFQARELYLTITIDNTNSAVWDGSLTNSISGYNVYYHPQTNYRLRGGATFTGTGTSGSGVSSSGTNGGGLQSLDAPP